MDAQIIANSLTFITGRYYYNHHIDHPAYHRPTVWPVFPQEASNKIKQNVYLKPDLWLTRQRVQPCAVWQKKRRSDNSSEIEQICSLPPDFKCKSVQSNSSMILKGWGGV